MGYVLNLPDNDDINIEYRYTVYQIIFPNEKKYIGCTSKTVKKRISDHIKAMESGIDYKLYRAMKKYVVNNLKIEILGKYKTKKEMFEYEKHYISFFNSQLDEYNSTSGGEGNPGRILTEENKITISKGQKERFSRPEEREATSKAVKDWIIKNPDKVLEAKKNKLKVIQSEEHREKMSVKMKEVYKNNPELVKKHNEKLIKMYEQDPYLKIKISRSLGGKPIFVYKDGKFVNCFDTLTDCARSLGLSSGTIGMVLSGKRSHTGGYTFRRGEWDDD